MCTGVVFVTTEAKLEHRVAAGAPVVAGRLPHRPPRRRTLQELVQLIHGLDPETPQVGHLRVEACGVFPFCVGGTEEARTAGCPTAARLG